MLIAFFRISRCRLRYSFSFWSRRISANICSGLLCSPSISAGACCLKYAFFHRLRLYSLHLSLCLAAVDHHFHCLATKLLFIDNVLSFRFHRNSLFSFELPCPSNRGSF